MSEHRWHKYIGLVLCLPLFLWALTGAIFLIKPGYSGAYEKLAPKLYPIEKQYSVEAQASWLEYRMMHSVLGYHLLVRSDEGWQHLNPQTLQALGSPTEDQYRKLLVDAISINLKRYGEVLEVQGLTAQTNTGVYITLDWNTLSFTQKGKDTRWISRLYKIHYLQWTSIAWLDEVFGVLGLISLFVLTFLGLRLSLSR